jgi:hypothetical protein
MEQQSGILRERLRQGSPDLYSALQRSWDIALSEWLPAIDATLGSTNSYPHLRNVERYLDHVIEAVEKEPKSAAKPLSEAEIYVLLSAVLFHDIGRSQSTSKNKDHGPLSHQLLQTRFPNLGIPSWEFAKSLSQICLYHDPGKGQRRVSVARELSTTVIDPYGPIREQLLAALLALADCMDSAFTRIIPSYLLPDASLGGVGLFRRTIRGVYFDPAAQMIRTVLTSGAMKETKRQKYILKPNMDREADWANMRRTAGMRENDVLLPEVQLKIDVIENAIAERLGKILKDKVDQQMDLCPGLHKTNPHVCWLLANGLIWIEPPQEKSNSGVSLPEEARIAAVLGNIREISETLTDIRHHLISAGIVVSAWVVEKEEHLFNAAGRQTFEPIFTKDYLKRVVDGMWHLCTHVFGASQFSYEELASHLGEPKTSRIHMAARRIETVSRGLPYEWAGHTCQNCDLSPISTSSTHWTWRVSFHDGICCCVYPEGIRNMIESLGDPYEPRS